MSELTAYERLLREELPTGTFGGPYSRPHPTLPATSPEDAARHAAELDEAVAAHDEAVRRCGRHLIPVPDHHDDAQEHAA